MGSTLIRLTAVSINQSIFIVVLPARLQHTSTLHNRDTRRPRLRLGGRVKAEIFGHPGAL